MFVYKENYINIMMGSNSHEALLYVTIHNV